MESCVDLRGFGALLSSALLGSECCGEAGQVWVRWRVTRRCIVAIMSKYEPLWRHVAEQQPESMTFDEIETVLGFPIDHSFLNFKKELTVSGFQVGKISLKNKTVRFSKVDTD
jgi:hypothetical protein